MYIPAPDLLQRTLLAEALQLSRCLVNGGVDAEPELTKRRKERLAQIQDILKQYAHPLCYDRLLVQTMPVAVRQAFVRATLLVTRYCQMGGGNWRGTLPSPTLSQYCADPIPANLRSREAIGHLCQVFDLPAVIQGDLAATLLAVDNHMLSHSQIIQAIFADLGTGVQLSKVAVLSLFQNLFGKIPVPAEAIDCIYTEAQIFFCLDYQGEQLRDAQLWMSLPEAERSQIQTFLRSLNQFGFETFHRFPTFGPCNSEQIDMDWCHRIAKSTNLSVAEVIQMLSRSVGLTPTSKAEALLVHDIWGHHWQLMLTHFVGDYEILHHCDEPLRAAETAYTPAGPLTCRELFTLSLNQVTIDETKARVFFKGEVQQRLGLVFTHLIGEMVADVAEFRFVWEHPQSADQLPSSSLFKAEPTKLDLSLADLDFLFLRVLRPLLEVHLSVFEDSGLESDLLMEWEQAGQAVQMLELRTSLKQAIVHLYQIFLAEYRSSYLPTMTGEASIFTQVASNLLYLQNAINSLYKDLISDTHPTLPFRDLLIVFIGCYCSDDSYADFWAIDDVLANYFLPCWHLLCGVSLLTAENEGSVQ